MENLNFLQLFAIFIVVLIANYLPSFLGSKDKTDISLDLESQRKRNLEETGISETDEERNLREDLDRQKEKNLKETSIFETDEERSKREIFTNAAKAIIDDEKSVIGELLSSQEQIITSLDFRTEQLNTRATKLTDILSNPQAYGELGEVTLDQLLKIVDYKINVHYFKKKPLEENPKLIPDFTFKLPENKIIHLDSKLNLAGYKDINELQEKLFTVKEQSEIDKINEAIDENIKKFKNATKKSIDDISAKYKEGLGDDTVDYVFMYVPYESSYSFLIEQSITYKDKNNNSVSETILKYALRKNVVITNPSLLMSYLSTIRQAVETFNIQSNVKEIISLQREFLEEWGYYKDAYGEIKTTLERAVKEWENVADTRTNVLERFINRMKNLIEEAEDED